MFKNAKRKPIALFMAIVMIATTVMSSTFLTLVNSTVSSADTAQIVTRIEFDAVADATKDTFLYPTTFPYENTEKKITINTNATFKGSSASSLTSNGWAQGLYWQIGFKPQGYENLAITFFQKSSSTGPKEFTLQCSTDGINWSNVTNYSVTSSLAQIPVTSLPTSISNVQDLYIRLTVASTTSVGGATIQPTGTSNLDSIVLTGTPVSGSTPVVVPDVVVPVTASIPSESVITPTTSISLDSPSVSASGAAIMMSVNGNADELYTGPFDLQKYGADEDTNTVFNIVTYAELNGQKSTYATYNYYTKDIQTISIAEARTKAVGTNRVRVQGIVNFLDNNNVYIEDATSGINLALNTTPSDITVGDQVTATGTFGTNKGLEQLSSVSYVVDSHNNPQYLTNATIAEINANPDNYEGRRVHIEAAKIGAQVTTGNTTLTQDTNTINIFKIPPVAGIEANATVKLNAVVGSYNTPQLRVFSATDVIKTADAPPVDNGSDTTTAPDPITADMVTSANASTVKDIYSATANSTATVIGQVAYVFGNFNSTTNTDAVNSVILQDVIDGKIVGLQIYDPSNTATKYSIGDIVTVTGTVGDNGAVRQLSNITAVNKIGSATPFKAQELTLAQLQAGGDNYLSEYVLIKNATIGARAANGTTNISDSTGSSTIYKAVTFPTGIVQCSQVNIYAAWSKYNTTYQLRNGASTDYISLSSDGTSVDTSIVLPLANWAGSGDITQATVYADLNTANDYLNTKASLTHSSGVIPLIKNTSSTGGTTYSIGTKGSKAGSYYELTLSSELYGNINLSYSMRGSASGPKNFDILYSTDGATWINAGTKSISADSVYEKFSVTLPAGANNASNLKIRVQVANDVSIGNSTIGSGNNYFNNISITGSPLVSDNIVGYPDITPDAGEVRIGQAISITSKTPDAIIYYSFDGQNYSVYSDANKPVFTSLPATVTTYAVKSGLLDSVKVTYGYTQEQVAPIKATPNGGAKLLGSTVELTCATEGAAITYSMDNGITWLPYNADSKIKLDKLPITIVAKAQLAGCKDSETSNFSFTQRLNDKYNIYFGQVHSHTDFSDGAGSCDQAFNYAKNTAKQIDFLAVTDHSNSLDGEATSSILDGSMSTEWNQGHALADQYTDSTFVGIYGFEMTWSNGLGHMNTFNTAGFQSRTQNDYKTYSTALQNYYATLKKDTGSISQFNHPGTTFGDFSDFAYYDEEIDNLISLIEVGNGEGAIGTSGYFPSYEYYTRALDKGWHVAPTNNQDNHKGYWGDANTARTVVLADSLTRDNIYDALRNMRTYATEDNDLEIQYTLNGEIMGSIIDSEPGSADINVQLKDPTDAEIGKVEVIVNGGLSVASETVTTNEKTVSFKLPADYSYYYIRVTQPDKNIAVTAPVWIGDVEAVGVASIKTTEALPVKGQAIDINTQFYNNEKDTATINSIQYVVNDKVVHEIDLSKAGLTSLPSKTTKDYSFKYTYDGVGSVSVNVIVNATLKGVNKVYKGILKLSYTDPSLVTNVVIDGTHFNDYVTGYYGGRMGNFTKIAANDNVKVTIVKDKITKEILDNCDLLIISAPAKKNGTDNAGPYSISHFEDSFIDLVKGYTDAGGALITCGIADYQDTADGQTTTEMNKLLAAIGATTRLNSDEAIDDVTNGGQKYRLYLTKYNAASEFLKGVVPDQKYSAYSGCTVLLDKTAVEQGKAEYLVKGHDTTYSIDSKTGVNYTEIQKGDANILTRETLASGSNVFVASTVFVSDFEVVAEIDNQFDLPYINRNITLNILDSIKKDVTITPVATVRTANKGDIFTVEGTVTAGTVSGNAFFDTIYLQDATGGINIFPINEGLIEVGQKVRVTGYLDEYLGDWELRVIKAEVIDKSINKIEPTQMTTAQSMDYSKNGGMLVKVQGEVSKVIKKNDVVETIIVKDKIGREARVFIDGYIKYSDAKSQKLEDIAIEGNTISAVGLVSYDPEGVRLRVRDRSEIVLVSNGASGSNGTASTQVNDGVTTVTTDVKANTQTKATVIKSTDAQGNETVKTVSVVSALDSGKLIETVTQLVTTGKGNDTKVTATITSDATGKVTEATAVAEVNGVSTTTVGDKTQIASNLLPEAIAQAAKLATKEVPLSVKVQLPSGEVSKFVEVKTTQKAEILVAIPSSLLSNEKVALDGIIIPRNVVATAKLEKKDVSLSVTDENGKELYSWSFDGSSLKDSKKKVTTINGALDIELLKDVETIDGVVSKYMPKEQSEEGLVLNFKHSGVLPDTASIRAYVGDKAGMEPGTEVFVYYFNDKAARLDEGSKVKQTIDKDGYLTIDIKHCSDYVVLPVKPDAKIVATLFEQFTVASKKSVNTGKTLNLAVTLPIEAENATVTYSSSKKSVATISKSGKVIAKKAGTTTITTKVKINGVTKSFKTKITVK